MTVEEFIEEWQGGSDCIIAHTSGSTGAPKEIKLPRQVVRASAWRSIRHFNLDSYSRLHLCLSPDYIAGKMVIVRAMECRATLSWEMPSATPLTGETPAAQPIDLLSVVGAQVCGLLKAQEKGVMPVVRNLLIGGAPLTPQAAALALKTGARVWESYGMTETASHIALREILPGVDPLATPFTCLPGIEIDTDVDGCLSIKIEGLDTLHTTDIVEMTGKGQFRLIGRRDNVIITGGHKIHPELVEATIRKAIPGLPRLLLTGRPDPRWGERLVLLLEVEEWPDTEGLLKRLASVLPSHSRPREIICRPSLAQTPTGKIIRKQ